MKKIAIYGKGGSGKSTISAALSVTCARRGLKVLQVGCDPKADSTLTLTDGVRIPTLLELLAQGLAQPQPDQFIVRGRLGIDCVEAGGPPPGAGCGGRGIARMFELFAELDLFASRDYDIVIFDVLGDVVCGGFAAPLRHGFADRAFVVVSEEPLSLYAANNIVQAVRSYGSNGVRLGGLALNVSDDVAAAKRVQRYASAIGSQVSGMIPRDPAIQLAEFEHRTAAEVVGRPDTVKAIEGLADAILDSFGHSPAIPDHLELEALFDLLANRPTKAPVREVSEPAVARSGDLTVAALEAVPATGRLLAPGKIVGGPRTLAAFEHLFRLGKGTLKHHGVAVVEAILDAGTVTVELSSGTLGKLRIGLSEYEDGGKVYTSVGRWGLSYEGTLSKTTSALLDYVAKRIERIDPAPELLLRAMTLDSEAGASEGAPAGKEQQRHLGDVPRHWCVWGEESIAGVFLFDEERQRKVYASLKLGGSRMLNIHHAGDVCQFSKQRSSPYSTHFIRAPWNAELPEHEFAEESDWLYTKLGEYHLIAGSNDVFESVLAKATSGHRDWDAVSIYVSCSPVIAGEDWRGAVRQFAKGYDGPILTMGLSDGDTSRDIITVARQTLEREGLEELAGTGVHFVGFPAARGRNELAHLLRQGGIEVHQVHLPAVQINRLPHFGQARAQLLWPMAEYERLYEELFKPLPVPAVTIEPPFGLAATDRFIRAAATASGVHDEAALNAVADLRASAADELTRLKPLCATHRVGIALTTRQAAHLDHPERTQGIPIARFLEELGFEVEVLTQSEDGARLDWWLRTGLSAVVTDVAHDERLLNLGIAPVGLADLEPGYAGAARSAQRILNGCATPFFKTFARYTNPGGTSR